MEWKKLEKLENQKREDLEGLLRPERAAKAHGMVLDGGFAAFMDAVWNEP